MSVSCKFDAERKLLRYFKRNINFFKIILVLQPGPDQYNITEKIKEANLKLNEAESQRQSQPKVRFRDHGLVDFAPDDDVDEVMEPKSHSTNAAPANNDSSDDGYTDEDIQEIEAIEIKDLTEDKKAESVEEDDDGSSAKDDFEDVPTKNSDKDENNSLPQKEHIIETVEHSKVIKISQETEPNDNRKNRKLCCCFKDTDEYKTKLPQYNGHNSNYGLSKEEISKRNERRDRESQHKKHKQMKLQQQQESSASLNEEAFSRWYELIR